MDLNKLRRMAGVREVYIDTTPLNEAQEVSLTNNLNELVGKKSERFILVHDPLSPESEAGDMISILDGPSFANVFIGAHTGTNDAKVAAKEGWTLYHFNQMNRALNDVNARLKKAGIDSVVTESVLIESYKNSYSIDDKVNTPFGEGKIVKELEKTRGDDFFNVEILEGEKKGKTYRMGTFQIKGHVTESSCGGSHAEDEETESGIEYNMEVECPICADGMPKEDFYDHMMDNHKAVMRGPYDDASEDEEMYSAPEDEEQVTLKFEEEEVMEAKKDKKKVAKKKTAKKSSKKVEDGTVNYNPSDVDESPESPMNDDKGKVKVPSEVKKALKTEIKDLRDAAKKIEGEPHNRDDFYADAANAMEEILKCLDAGTAEEFKRAQIFMAKLMGPITQRIPNVAYEFLTGSSTSGIKLKDLFTEIKNKKKK